MQLARDVKPILDKRGDVLAFISIGKDERAREFAKLTGMPAECIFADPDNASYAALGLYQSVARTFFNPATPLAFQRRVVEGNVDDIVNVVTKTWKPWVPPRSSQAFQQGGTFALVPNAEGTLEPVFSWYDEATAAHAPFEDFINEMGEP